MPCTPSIFKINTYHNLSAILCHGGFQQNAYPGSSVSQELDNLGVLSVRKSRLLGQPSEQLPSHMKQRRSQVSCRIFLTINSFNMQFKHEKGTRCKLTDNKLIKNTTSQVSKNSNYSKNTISRPVLQMADAKKVMYWKILPILDKLTSNGQIVSKSNDSVAAFISPKTTVSLNYRMNNPCSAVLSSHIHVKTSSPYNVY